MDQAIEQWVNQSINQSIQRVLTLFMLSSSEQTMKDFLHQDRIQLDKFGQCREYVLFGQAVEDGNEKPDVGNALTVQAANTGDELRRGGV